MVPARPDGRVTVFGATGYTGRLCARAAVAAGLRVRLAGRRSAALAALAAELGGDVETAVADARDPAALHALAAATDVLVTTVGPYGAPAGPGASGGPPAGLGRPVLEAALAGGAHYVDVSAEAGFLAWAYDQDAQAADAGVVLCPGFGLDGVPGELLAALAAGDRRVDEVRVGYLARGALPSAGTLRTIPGIVERGGLALAGGVLTPETVFADAWTLPFPPPLGPRPGVSVPAPELLTVRRSLGAADARAYIALPSLPGGTAAAELVGRAATALARTPLWAGARAAADLLPAGPSARQRVGGRVAVVAEVRGPGGTARAWCRLTDVYGTTARIVVGTVRRLLAGGVEPGARTPSQVVGDAGAFLEAVGARWEHLPVA